MKRLFRTVAGFVIAMSMICAPVADAQQRGRDSHFSGSSSGSSSPSRPGSNNGSRPSSRPSGNNGKPSNSRPGSSNGNQNKPRPGGNNGSTPNSRPSGSNGHQNGPRPGGSQNAPRPGGNWNRPGNNPGRPGNNRPAPPPHSQRPAYSAHNHHVPFFGHYSRPVPPPAWRPAYVGGPSFGTILGVALGTTLSVSLNALINSGYTVNSYGNDAVYLSNVSQMNYIWPDAALYYNNGLLCGSSFTYPTAYYDMSRYNHLYNVFTSQYGMPVSRVNSGGVISATWFGAGNRFVTLEFNSNYGNYYTTLNFGY